MPAREQYWKMFNFYWKTVIWRAAFIERDSSVKEHIHVDDLLTAKLMQCQCNDQSVK